MTAHQWIPDAPAPDDAWMLQFTEHLRAHRPDLPVFSARQMAPEGFEVMHLLTPQEAAELWDECMVATNASWRRLARR